MRVVKVVLKGITTSFRHPHFMWGRHPTYPMPPPATVFGHICSALGYIPPPGSFQFGYRFKCAGRFVDLEWLYKVRAASPTEKKGGFTTVGEGDLVRRDVLFRPRLVLYIARPDWLDAFRNPRYPVVLGRSQDLATYVSFEVVELQRSSAAYYEGTLLPFKLRPFIARGYALYAPLYIDPISREAVFRRFIVIADRIRVPSDDTQTIDGQFPLEEHWIDPNEPTDGDYGCGVWFWRLADGTS